MAVERKLFGELNGKSIYKYIISNSSENSVEIITLGATVTSLVVSDKNGKKRDVLLGFDSVSDYMERSDYQGATVGPVCNRIGGAAFDINGTHYKLTANEKGITCLHSGGEFSFAVWDAIVVDSDAVELRYVSPNGMNGFPGETTAVAVFRFDEENALHINYEAVSDRDTFINLTNHAYFNLNGYSAGDILSHEITINADSITAVDENSIPTGVKMPVDGTPFDFRKAKKIGADIDIDCEQLNFTSGFDHNFCVNGYDGTLRKIADVFSADSGIKMNVYTSLPGVQFYAGNFLSGAPGKCGKPMEKRTGFCLETQFFPDTPNHDDFPGCLFPAGEKYTSETVYSFELI